MIPEAGTPAASEWQILPAVAAFGFLRSEPIGIER
ncbi:hypothetical protein MSS2_04724 [Mycobacterium marinum]|nr:hypothetical protein MSS2_04724 [Mycobacterium marinum]CDM74948.1 hypothetical protein MMARE11_08000 [Mycobacterium marinum E11]